MLKFKKYRGGNVKKIIPKLMIIFVILFVVSIVWGSFSAYYCSKSNENYQELQEEFIDPDIIDTVMYDEELKQIYVCYYYSNYVNVYNESGDFLWCVGIDTSRGLSCAIDDDKLIISSQGYGYIYDAKNGAFLEETNDEEFLYKYDEKSEEILVKNRISFDSTQIYKEDSNGILETIVSRPKWYKIFDVKLFGACAIFAAIVIGLGYFIIMYYGYLESKDKAEFRNKKAKVIKNYFKVTSIVQVASALLITVFKGIFTLSLIIIVPHFIISNIVLLNIMDKLPVSDDEETVLHFWKIVNIITFALPIALFVIYLFIFG